MFKPITRPEHGFTDYPSVAAVSAAPTLFGFEDEPRAAQLCRLPNGGSLVSSMLTRAEWGFVRVMPDKTHLVLDVLDRAALGAPWLFGFAGNVRARNTFLAMGVFGLAAGLLSQPDEMPPEPGEDGRHG